MMIGWDDKGKNRQIITDTESVRYLGIQVYCT